MSEWISNLKQVVLVVLICEFLKEFLSTDSFRKYVQFSVRLFLFLFLVSSLFRIDFLVPDFSLPTVEVESDNLLIADYENQIATKLMEELHENRLDVSDVQVTLDEQYHISSVTVFSKENPEKIKTVLKGDFPYEVVHPSEEFLYEPS